jgi:AraC-like DNA-binding protein
LWLEATGPCSVIAARFRPAAARAFVGGSMRRTTDRRLALDEIAPGIASGLVEKLVREATAEARSRTLAQWVGELVEHAAFPQDLAARRAAEHLEARRGQAEMGELQAASGLGPRAFQRRFGDQVGVGPKLLATIFRFRSVFDLIEHDSSRPWTDASLAAGYFDQSHFIRDFRRFVGCTPSGFQRTASGLAAALA